MLDTTESVEIVDPVLLIRITRLYRDDMTAEELYDATRAAWVLGRRREDAEYALAVFGGIVREVYSIDSWHPGGTTLAISGIHDAHGPRDPDRWEFIGKVAPERVRSRYIGCSVSEYLPKGLRNPVTYVNC